MVGQPAPRTLAAELRVLSGLTVSATLKFSIMDPFSNILSCHQTIY